MSSEGAEGGDDHLSGVPWGGLNIQHMVARGHRSASQQGGSQQPSPQLASPQQPYYDYDYDYDNSAPYGGSGSGSHYAGTASSSFGYGGGGGGMGSSSYDASGTGGLDDRYFDTSASSSSPSYLSYDAFSTGEDSGSNSGARY